MHHSAGSSISSKLPHGLTVQELKEMTRARLAAEAAEMRETVKSGDSVDSRSHVNGINQSRQVGYLHLDSRSDDMNRQRILSLDSFGSAERQRLGSVESFTSTPSAAFGGYPQGLLSPSLSNDYQEQPPLSSFSYDAMDNESYASGLGSESFFGSETQCSKTTKYSAGSSVYKLPFSANKASPSSYASTKVTTNVRNDGWNDTFTRSTSPSTLPTVSHSVNSFGAGGNEPSTSFFSSIPAAGNAERLVSAGAVVPNSVAESVLGTSDDNVDDADRDLFHNHNPSINLSSEMDQLSNDDPPSYNSPWSTSRKVDANYKSGDLEVSQLQTKWNSFLNVNASSDDFPLSTLTSKATRSFGDAESSLENQHYSSPFQTVPEERVIQGLVSRDGNVPESFLDDHAQDLDVPKLSNRIRRNFRS